jgi:hypothetical protein
MEDAEALGYALSEVEYDSAKVPQALERTFCLRFLRASLVQHFSNASSLDPTEMEKARNWSIGRNSSSGTGVPNSQEGANSPVQDLISRKVKEHADSFDIRATSGWVMNYQCAKEFERDQGDKFVLSKVLD